MLKLIAPVVLALAVMGGAAFAGPFGLEKEQSASSLKFSKEFNPKQWNRITVDNPHRLFKSYVAFASESSGLCGIRAATELKDSDAYGYLVRSDFDAIKSQLDTAYGSGILIDYLRIGSIWDEPKYWSMGITKN